jgi:hypothetical protein
MGGELISYFAGMVLADKIVMILCLFTGFLWLRKRARASNPEKAMGKTILGVFVILPAILIGMNHLFERWHFGPYTDLLIKVVLLIVTFAAIGFVFLKPAPADRGPEDPSSVP